jgi:hypothetical protein
MDHRVETRGAQLLRAPLALAEQQSGDAQAAVIGVHDEAVQMAAPSVPPDDERSDHVGLVVAGQNEGLGVAREQRTCLVLLAQGSGRSAEATPE